MDFENNTQVQQDVYQQIPEEEPSALQSFWDMVKYMIAIVIAVVFIRYVFISPFAVEGSSMEPNLHTSELIIVNKIGYSTWFGIEFGEPKRGDVVVLHPPNNPKKYYIKRIIGLPGDTVYFHNGDIVIENEEYPNGITLDETYLSADNATTTPPNGLRNTKVEIGPRNYYVLGDNRKASSDSRSFGPVHERNIIGKTEAVMYPLQDVRSVEGHNYEL